MSIMSTTGCPKQSRVGFSPVSGPIVFELASQKLEVAVAPWRRGVLGARRTKAIDRQRPSSLQGARGHRLRVKKGRNERDRCFYGTIRNNER